MTAPQPAPGAPWPFFRAQPHTLSSPSKPMPRGLGHALHGSWCQLRAGGAVRVGMARAGSETASTVDSGELPSVSTRAGTLVSSRGRQGPSDSKPRALGKAPDTGPAHGGRPPPANHSQSPEFLGGRCPRSPVV